MRISDWSSDVCSSDLQPHEQFPDPVNRRRPFTPGKPQDRAEDQRAQYALPQRYTKPEGKHASDRAAAITPFGGPFHHPVDHPGLSPCWCCTFGFGGPVIALPPRWRPPAPPIRRHRSRDRQCVVRGKRVVVSVTRGGGG